MYAMPPHWCGTHHPWIYVPVCLPIPCAPDPCALPMTVPFELLVTGTTTQEALIGGSAIVHPTLEYLVKEGAAAPQVTVTITADGATTTWSESGIDVGYHVKTDFAGISPGAVVQVDTVDVTARLRWCERLCC